MAECTDPARRDQLPGLLHPSGIAAADRRELEAHVEACAACRDELRLLEAVRAATVAPTINAARIATSLPPYQRARVVERARWLLPTALAATLVIAVSVVWNRESAPPVPDTVVGSVLAGPAAGELAIGDNLDDLTEADLRALVDELTALEPMPETEPDLLLPALDGEGAL